jgi:hypothetical protein
LAFLQATGPGLFLFFVLPTTSSTFPSLARDSPLTPEEIYYTHEVEPNFSDPLHMETETCKTEKVEK